MADQMTKRRAATRLTAWAGLVCLTLAAAACTTSQARDVHKSGFLNDYSQLREGKGDEALLVYLNPEANWAGYTMIHFEPVVSYANSELTDVPRDQLQHFVDYVDAAVRGALSDDYQFVDHDGPGVMHLRIAVTEASGAFVPLNVLSTITPAGRVLAEMKQLALGTGAFTGSASVEAEIVDGVTGERMWAVVDKRVGRKAVKGMFSKWSDVTEAYDWWAQRLDTRLGELRSAGR